MKMTTAIEWARQQTDDGSASFLALARAIVDAVMPLEARQPLYAVLDFDALRAYATSYAASTPEERAIALRRAVDELRTLDEALVASDPLHDRLRECIALWGA